MSFHSSSQIKVSSEPLADKRRMSVDEPSDPMDTDKLAANVNAKLQVYSTYTGRHTSSRSDATLISVRSIPSTEISPVDELRGELSDMIFHLIFTSIKKSPDEEITEKRSMLCSCCLKTVGSGVLLEKSPSQNELQSYQEDLVVPIELTALRLKVLRQNKQIRDLLEKDKITVLSFNRLTEDMMDKLCEHIYQMGDIEDEEVLRRLIGQVHELICQLLPPCKRERRRSDSV